MHLHPPAADLPPWKAIVGLRNRLVHEEMNVDLVQVLEPVVQEREGFVVGVLFAR